MRHTRTAVVAASVAALVGCTSPTSPTVTANPTGPTSTPSPSVSRTAATAPDALPQWLAGSVVTRLPTTRRVIALTFDGGAGAQGAAAILHTLQGAGVPATFFLTGQFVRSYPAVTAAVIDGHYLLGNHTMTHPHLTQLSPARVLAEVTAAQERIEAATAQSPRPWFRFPFGEYDARTLRIVHRLGYGAIGWTVDTRGWQGTQAGGVADLVARVHDALRPGAIVLMHLGANPDDGTTYDAVALPAVIAMVRAAGYRFVDLRHAFIVQIRSQ